MKKLLLLALLMMSFSVLADWNNDQQWRQFNQQQNETQFIRNQDRQTQIMEQQNNRQIYQQFSQPQQPMIIPQSNFYIAPVQPTYFGR